MSILQKIRSLVGRPPTALRRFKSALAKINDLSSSYRARPDAELSATTGMLRDKLAAGALVDDILFDAFAAVRETSRRTRLTGESLGLYHHDSQILAGLALHHGLVAEMDTGEGKTLAATCPAYLNALLGDGVHIVTVNDYLARRDWEWMAPVYRRLGLTVECIQHANPAAARRNAYAADITYACAQEVGMDHLRDHRVMSYSAKVQRRSFAIIDDVDHTLIDEARIPLSLTSSSKESVERYALAENISRRLVVGRHFSMTGNEITLNDRGIESAQDMLGVEDFFSSTAVEQTQWPYLIRQALCAYHFYRRDQHYIVQSGSDGEKVVIIDQQTQRLLPGRRWDDGLHQAIEQKEGVSVQPDSVTVARITIQHLFTGYERLAGMTGTALAEAQEFREIYGLEIVRVSPNAPNIRRDFPDVVYRTEAEKLKAILDEVEDYHAQGGPVLIGVADQEKTRSLAEAISRRGLTARVLSAKNEEMEAEIIKDAGSAGSITIVTRMAGRGTDIQLGPGVAELSGLYVIGTQRDESRRIDDQLRGRCGRQGDPGATRFFLSLDDSVMRRFGHSEKVQVLMKKIGMEEGEAIEHKMVSRAIERAQEQIEAANFRARSILYDYDRVLNDQRMEVYRLRDDLLRGDGSRQLVFHAARTVLEEAVGASSGRGLRRDREEIGQKLKMWIDPDVRPEVLSPLPETAEEEVEIMLSVFVDRYVARVETDRALLREQTVTLQTLDACWRDQLQALNELQGAVRLLPGDPLVGFKRKAYDLFKEMNTRLRWNVAAKLLRPGCLPKARVDPGLRSRLMAELRSRLMAELGGAPGPAQLRDDGE